MEFIFFCVINACIFCLVSFACTRGEGYIWRLPKQAYSVVQSITHTWDLPTPPSSKKTLDVNVTY